MKSRIVVCILAAAILVSASHALAGDDGGRAYGVRIGYGSDPNQFVAGAQADLGKIYSKLHFVPSVDFGFGDNATTICFNGDLEMFLPLPKSPVAFYGLAGPTFTYWKYENVDGDFEVGLSLGIGARMNFGGSGWYNMEARFGISDIPDFRILLGILFGGRKE